MFLLKLLKMIFTGIAAIVPLLGLVIYKFQNKLVYPSYLVDGKVERPTNIPFEELHLKTSDGVTIHGFLLMQDQTDPFYTKKTIMILCPNAGNIGHAIPTVELFYRQMHHNVIIYSYRGYGESTGVSNEVGLKIDADTVMSFINDHPVLSNTSLILYGRSLGGAVAIYIASKNYVQVKAVILENTFLSIPKCIPHVFPMLSPVSFMCHQKWDSEHDITNISPEVSMLFLCATNDDIVPPAHMQTLYEISNAESKKRIVFQGYHHNDTNSAPGYWRAVTKFISEAK